MKFFTYTLVRCIEVEDDVKINKKPLGHSLKVDLYSVVPLRIPVEFPDSPLLCGDSKK